MNNKKYLFLTVTIILISVAWYFLYWIKTPQYSLTLIANATKQHDLNQFEKHVDMHLIYSKAYDDILTIAFEDEETTNPIIMALAKGLKNVAVPILTDQTKYYVKYGKLKYSNPEVANKQVLQNSGADVVNSLKYKSGIEHLQYQGVEHDFIDGNTALVTIKVYDTQLSKHFLIKLKMKQLEDRSWCLIEISNLQEFIKERDNSLKEKLFELNTPARKQLEDTASIKQQHLSLAPSAQSALIKMLKADIDIKNNSIHTITYINGYLEIYSPENQLFYTGNFASAKRLEPQQNISYAFEWELNPFIASDNNVMQSDLNKITWKVYLTDIAFIDGSTIQLVTELPLK